MIEELLSFRIFRLWFSIHEGQTSPWPNRVLLHSDTHLEKTGLLFYWSFLWRTSFSIAMATFLSLLRTSFFYGSSYVGLMAMILIGFPLAESPTIQTNLCELKCILPRLCGLSL